MILARSAFIAATGLATVLWLLASDARAEDSCQLKLLTSLPATMNSAREIFVPVSINGTELKFLFNTGTTASTLQRHVADKLDIAYVGTSGFEIYDIGGKYEYRATRVHEFKIGNRAAHDFGMALLEEPAGKLPDYDGTIGSEFLDQFDVEVDLDGGKINLYSLDHCDGKVLYWADSGFVAPFHKGVGAQVDLRVLLNGKEFGAILSSGRPKTLISWRVAHDLGIEENTPGLVPAVLQTPSGDPLKAAEYQLDSTEFGGEKISKVAVTIGGSGITAPAISGSNVKNHDPDSEVMFGVEFFMYNRVFISYRESKIYFTPYNGAQIKAIFAKMAAK